MEQIWLYTFLPPCLMQFSSLFWFVFPPPRLVLLFLTCYILKHCSVTESGFLLPGALYSIGLVSILGIEPLPQILPIMSGASMGNFWQGLA